MKIRRWRMSELSLHPRLHAAVTMRWVGVGGAAAEEQMKRTKLNGST